MVVASQQITVKVDPLKQSKGQRRHRGEHREETAGEREGAAGKADRVGSRGETGRPLFYSSSS